LVIYIIEQETDGIDVTAVVLVNLFLPVPWNLNSPFLSIVSPTKDDFMKN